MGLELYNVMPRVIFIKPSCSSIHLKTLETNGSLEILDEDPLEGEFAMFSALHREEIYMSLRGPEKVANIEKLFKSGTFL